MNCISKPWVASSTGQSAQECETGTTWLYSFWSPEPQVLLSGHLSATVAQNAPLPRMAVVGNSIQGPEEGGSQGTAPQLLHFIREPPALLRSLAHWPDRGHTSTLRPCTRRDMNAHDRLRSIKGYSLGWKIIVSARKRGLLGWGKVVVAWKPESVCNHRHHPATRCKAPALSPTLASLVPACTLDSHYLLSNQKSSSIDYRYKIPPASMQPHDLSHSFSSCFTVSYIQNFQNLPPGLLIPSSLRFKPKKWI